MPNKKNEHLFCKDLKSTTTGKDPFEFLKENISKTALVITQTEVHQSWETKKDLLHLCAKKIQILFKRQLHDYRESLVSKFLTPNMLIVMNQVIQVVNFIKI